MAVANDKLMQLFSISALNVNNANSLIMQGRITEVINMKPSEIVSLVGETAGINTCKDIKKKTLSLVVKKDTKLDGINHILNNEVLPMMERLKKENEEYVAWKELCSEIDRIEKKVKAATFYEI